MKNLPNVGVISISVLGSWGSTLTLVPFIINWTFLYTFLAFSFSAAVKFSGWAGCIFTDLESVTLVLKFHSVTSLRYLTTAADLSKQSLVLTSVVPSSEANPFTVIDLIE